MWPLLALLCSYSSDSHVHVLGLFRWPAIAPTFLSDNPTLRPYATLCCSLAAYRPEVLGLSDTRPSSRSISDAFSRVVRGLGLQPGAPPGSAALPRRAAAAARRRGAHGGRRQADEVGQRVAARGSQDGTVERPRMPPAEGSIYLTIVPEFPPSTLTPREHRRRVISSAVLRVGIENTTNHNIANRLFR